MLCARALMRRVVFRGASTNIRSVSSMFDLLAELPKQSEEKLQEINIFKDEETVTQEAYDGITKLRVLCNGAGGGSQSVVVQSPGSAYFFNCGEGTQRLCRNTKTKFRKVKTVFFTSPRWENIGGFLGFVLSLKSVNMTDILVKGHEFIPRLQELTSNFIHLHNVKLRQYANTEFSDGAMNIRSVKINRKHGANDEDLWPSDHDTSKDFVLAYICRPEKRSLSISLENCVKLGIPPGPQFTKLKAGEEITLEDGRVIKPSDVIEADHKEVIIILECPSQSYVDGFLAAEEFKAHQPGAGVSQDAIAQLVVHMTPKNVFESVSYQSFLERFHPDTVHLQLNRENNHEQNSDSFRKQYVLHRIHPELFPLLPRSKQAGVSALTVYSFKMKPNLEDSINIQPEEYIQSAENTPNFNELVSKFKKQLEKLPVNDIRTYPLVTFLGTGSSVPSKERNVSSILITTQPDAYVLLDCGESTCNQIIHHYGVEGAEHIIRNLRCIYVSHIHADHHMGIITILKMRRMLGLNDNLLILGPVELMKWLQRYSNIYERIAFDFMHNETLREKHLSNEHKFLFDKLGVDRIATCFVPHCVDSYGVRIDVDGYGIVYSGDTKIAPSLVKLGRNCDLLIHEATEEAGREREANLKCHSTTAQAIEVGRQMNAKFTFLTHFSQRYCKLPNFDDSIFEEGRVGFAFDHMQISPKNLTAVPLLYPALKTLFWENYETMMKRSEAASHKRQVVALAKKQLKAAERVIKF